MDEIYQTIENKDYTKFEIQEAENYIAQNRYGGDRKNRETNQYFWVWHPVKEKLITKIFKDYEKYGEPATQLLRVKAEEELRALARAENRNFDLQWKIEKELNANALDQAIKKLLKDEVEYNKSLALTYDLNTARGLQKTKELFYKTTHTPEQAELFEYILPIAKKLGVEVRQALRNPYEVRGSTKTTEGIYHLTLNSARVKHSKTTLPKHEILLHELIHSVTSRAIHAYEQGATHLLTRQQIRAIENIEAIYKQLHDQADELGLKIWNERTRVGDYGLHNSHELIAELANPRFSEKLKKINLFEKIIDNIIQLFISAAEIVGLKKTNAYNKLKESLKEIVENYKPDFTQEYEKQSYKDLELMSQRE